MSRFVNSSYEVLSSHISAFVLLASIGLLIYWPALQGPFIFDDNLLVEHNALIQSFSNFSSFFTANSQTGAAVSGSNFYRPLQYIVYAVLYAMAGLSPVVFHAASIALHVLSVWLVFLLLGVLGFSFGARTVSTLLFAVHPVQAEAVAYVSGIADPLYTCFLLSGLIASIALRARPRVLALIVISTLVAALLSKESAVIFVPLLILVTWYTYPAHEPERAQVLSFVVALASVLTTAYVLLKFTVLDFTGVGGLTDAANVYTQQVTVRLTTYISILFDYAKLVVAPVQLYLERPYVAYESLWSLRGLFGTVLVSASGVAVVWHATPKFVRLGVAWFWIALVPVSGIVPLNAMYLEHWLYVPLVGLCILVAGAIDLSGSRIRIVLMSVLLCVAAVFGYRTYERAIQWSDPVLFYTNEIHYAPTSARVHNNLAMEYTDRGRYEDAIHEYTQAIALQDVYPQTHHNLANAYLTMGDTAHAEQEYLRALQLDPTFAYSYGALIDLYRTTNPPKAQLLERASPEQAHAILFP